MTQNQLQYMANLETARSNLAKEQETYRDNLAKLEETKRNNIAQLEESRRSHLANEENQRRANEINAMHYERLDSEQARHNEAVERETSLHNRQTEILNAESNYIRQYEVRQQGDVAYSQLAETVRAHKAGESINAYNSTSQRLASYGTLLRGRSSVQQADTAERSAVYSRRESAARTKNIETQTRRVPFDVVTNSINSLTGIAKTLIPLLGR